MCKVYFKAVSYKTQCYERRSPAGIADLLREKHYGKDYKDPMSKVANWNGYIRDGKTKKKT